MAMTPRRGPVHINLPRDILSGTAQFPPFQSPRNYRSTSVPVGSQTEVEQTAELLSTAKRPVIVAGGGIKNSGGFKDLLNLAEILNAPIVTSPGHGDAIPFGHPLNTGQMGPRGNPVVSALVKQADVILVLGTRLGFNSTMYSYEHINEHAKIIQIEQEPTAIGRYFPVMLGIWADSPSVARHLCNALRKFEPARAGQ